MIREGGCGENSESKDSSQRDLEGLEESRLHRREEGSKPRWSGRFESKNAKFGFPDSQVVMQVIDQALRIDEG